MTRSRQDRARRVMLTLSALCFVVAAAPAVDQVVVRGWGAFLERPAGVGASEGGEKATVATPQLPQAEDSPPRTPSDDGAPAQAAPPVPAPLLRSAPRFGPSRQRPVVAAPQQRMDVPRRGFVHRRR